MYAKSFLVFTVLAASPAFAVPSLSANEKTMRQALSELVTPAGEPGTHQYLYQGKTNSGASCVATVSARWEAEYRPNRANGTSSLDVELAGEGIEDGFYIGFGGEGPEGIYGNPLNSLHPGVNTYTIHMVENDPDHGEDWTLDLGFSADTHALEKLSSIRGRTQRTGEELQEGSCQDLKFAARLTDKSFDQIEKDINAHLDDENEVEIFNGCTIGSSLDTLECGFAIDGENNDQGQAVFHVEDHQKLSFVKLEMLGDE